MKRRDLTDEDLPGKGEDWFVINHSGKPENQDTAKYMLALEGDSSNAKSSRRSAENGITEHNHEVMDAYEPNDLCMESNAESGDQTEKKLPSNSDKTTVKKNGINGRKVPEVRTKIVQGSPEEEIRKKMEELAIQRQKRIAERTAAAGGAPGGNQDGIIGLWQKSLCLLVSSVALEALALGGRTSRFEGTSGNSTWLINVDKETRVLLAGSGKELTLVKDKKKEPEEKKHGSVLKYFCEAFEINWGFMDDESRVGWTKITIQQCTITVNQRISSEQAETPTSVASPSLRDSPASGELFKFYSSSPLLRSLRKQAYSCDVKKAADLEDQTSELQPQTWNANRGQQSATAPTLWPTPSLPSYSTNEAATRCSIQHEYHHPPTPPPLPPFVAAAILLTVASVPLSPPPPPTYVKNCNSTPTNPLSTNLWHLELARKQQPPASLPPTLHECYQELEQQAPMPPRRHQPQPTTSQNINCKKPTTSWGNPTNS
ncbi:hypothetical protein NC651_009811 [Populus alba x Populus x berolinensis]|nr:hypothetical protein NC651_009811 [Populus alba x Populus x berolinensis]